MTTAVKVIDQICDSAQQRFAPVLAGNPTLGIEPFVMGIRSALMANNQLANVARQNPGSLFSALAEAAALGLSPDPQMEHFYPIPYGKEVQAQVGYRGYMFLAEQSGQIDDIGAMVIYADEFEALRAEGVRLVDRKTGDLNLDEEDRIMGQVDTSDENIVAAIAWARIKGRPKQITQLMTRDQIEKRRKAGHGNTPAWKSWYPEQCRKTVLKALLRSGRVPLGAHHRRIMSALEAEDAARAVPEAEPVTATIMPEPLPSIEVLDHQRRENDPLPSDEDRAQELLGDIWRIADALDVDADLVNDWCHERHGCDCNAETPVEALADVRRALDAGEIEVQGQTAAEFVESAKGGA